MTRRDIVREAKWVAFRYGERLYFEDDTEEWLSEVWDYLRDARNLEALTEGQVVEIYDEAFVQLHRIEKFLGFHNPNAGVPFPAMGGER